MTKSLENFSFSGLLFFISIALFMIKTEAGVIGLNYGLLGNNLPHPNEVINLLKSKNITSIRIFNPNIEVLQALQNTGIQLILGTLNQDLQPLSSDLTFASNWVQTNVIPFAKLVRFRAISAGNEVIPSNMQNYVLPAMQNLKSVLDQALATQQLTEPIPVTTAIAMSALGNSYPPSQGQFSIETQATLGPIAQFLAQNHSPLLVNVYPYFPYVSNIGVISLDYALFKSNDVVVRDGALVYSSLFDAMVDSVYSALEKVGGQTVEIIVSESGWPSGGSAVDVAATIVNAQTYNNNLIRHISGNIGTPKRPGKHLETYVFALFNENLKPPGTEQNFGLFYPNMTEVYNLNFSGI